MKKKVLALFLASAMAVSMLSACGSSKEAEKKTEEAKEAVEEKAEEAADKAEEAAEEVKEEATDAAEEVKEEATDAAEEVKEEAEEAVEGAEEAVEEAADEATEAAEEVADAAEETAEEVADAAEEVKEEAAEAVGEAADAAEEAVEGAEEAVEEAADEATDAAEEAVEGAEEAVEEAADEATDAAEEVADEAAEAVEGAEEAVEEAAEEATDAAEEVAEDAADAAEEVKEDAEEAVEEVADEAADAAEEVKEDAAEAVEEAADAAEEVKEDAEEAVEEAADDAADAAEEVKEDAEEAVEEAADAAEEAVEGAEEAVEEAADEAADAAEEVKEDAEEAVEEAADAAEEVKEEAEEAVEEAADEAADAAEEVKEDAEEAVEEAADEAADKAEEAADEAADKAEEVAEDAADAVEEAKDTVEGAVEEAKDAVEGAVEEVKDAAEEVQEEAAEAVGAAADKAEEAVGAVAAAGTAAAGAAVAAVGDAAAAVKEDAEEAAEGIKEEAEDAVEGIKEDVAEAIGAAEDKADEAEEAVEEAVDEAAEEVEEAADEAAEEVEEAADEAAEEVEEAVDEAEAEVAEAAEEAVEEKAEEAAEETEEAAEPTGYASTIYPANVAYKAASYNEAAPDWTEYTDLIAQIKAETDMEKRVALMHEAEDILMGTAAVIPIYYYNDIFLQKADVEGIYSNLFGFKFFQFATTPRDVLKINLASEPAKVDPALNSSVDGACLAVNMFAGLYTYNEEGALEPDLCDPENPFEMSEDGLVYTFHLQEGLKWSDGTDVTAKDFEYAWKRAADPKTAADYGYMFDCFALGDDGLINVEATDDLTLVATLNAPCAYFLDLCAFPAYLPVPQAQVEAAADWETNPGSWAAEAGFVTNGAYTMDSWKHEESIVLKKNPNYHKAEQVSIEEIDLMLSADDTAIYAAYQSDDLDFADTVPTNEIQNLLDNPEFHIIDNLGTYYAAFNVNSPIFEGKTVDQAIAMRKAFAILIDRAYIVENVGQTGQKVATSYIPAGMADGNGGVFKANTDAYTFPNEEFEGYYPEYPDGVEDEAIEEAIALLEYAGYEFEDGVLSDATPISIKYLTNDGTGHIAVAEAMQQDFAEIGIDMSIETREWNVFLDERKDGQFDFAREGWLADFNDPINMLEMWTPQSGNNDCQFGKEVVAATEEAEEEAAE